MTCGCRWIVRLPTCPRKHGLPLERSYRWAKNGAKFVIGLAERGCLTLGQSLATLGLRNHRHAMSEEIEGKEMNYQTFQSDNLKELSTLLTNFRMNTGW